MSLCRFLVIQIPNLIAYGFTIYELPCSKKRKTGNPMPLYMVNVLPCKNVEEFCHSGLFTTFVLRLRLLTINKELNRAIVARNMVTPQRYAVLIQNM